MSGSGTIDGCRFVGHRCFNNGRSGFVVFNLNAKNLAFNDCDVSGNSVSDPGVWSGFDIQGGVSDFSITSCRSGQQANFSNSQARGILINGGASNNYIITNNDLRLNTVEALYQGGTGINKVINNNLGFTDKNSGTGTIVSGQSSVTITHGLTRTPSADKICISPLSAMGSNHFYIDSTSITSTQFTVRTASNVGSDSHFSWQAML